MGLERAEDNSARNVKATVSACSSALDMAVLAPYRWVAENATIDLPLVTTVLDKGWPPRGRPVVLQVVSGNATLNSGIAYADINGCAGTTVPTHNLSGDLRVRHVFLRVHPVRFLR
ncbi:MAG: hypothetical protein DMG70_28695 [Acidobacteria bacterium]|nr:MAG: hypothetical protein DMG70_28695 [Acidobacteriota bacterium]PYY10122.1 MAG: hypothetical protein DMG69_07625 [Acidobacteriota bacterium]